MVLPLPEPQPLQERSPRNASGHEVLPRRPFPDLHGARIAAEPVQLKVADHIRNVVDDPLWPQDDLIAHPGHIEIDNHAQFVHELQHGAGPHQLLRTVPRAIIERPGFPHELHDRRWLQVVVVVAAAIVIHLGLAFSLCRQCRREGH